MQTLFRAGSVHVASISPWKIPNRDFFDFNIGDAIRHLVATRYVNTRYMWMVST
jgi:hypothetical protein